MKKLAAVMVMITGLCLIAGVGDFPNWGDPNSPANSYLSTYYLTNAISDTAVPNIVTAILADYRGYDTMFETVVVFVAGLGILFLLRGTKKKLGDHPTAFPSSSIVRTACRIMIPMMQLFALYVVAHGHHSPGGGFQGGVILGASVILLAISEGLSDGLKRITLKNTIKWSAIGVLIYSGIGTFSMLLGGNFLDYSAWAPILPATDAVMARSHGMLGVEIGVALTVMTVMFSIYADLASHGQMDEGL
ncbi:MAG: Na(+)/H(+) antiporter subunit B [bacterium]|nr:Na(+)/H(+) antiporter subunit B [bacterium]